MVNVRWTFAIFRKYNPRQVLRGSKLQDHTQKQDQRPTKSAIYHTTPTPPKTTQTPPEKKYIQKPLAARHALGVIFVPSGMSGVSLPPQHHPRPPTHHPKTTHSPPRKTTHTPPMQAPGLWRFAPGVAYRRLSLGVALLASCRPTPREITTTTTKKDGTEKKKIRVVLYIGSVVLCRSRLRCRPSGRVLGRCAPCGLRRSGLSRVCSLRGAIFSGLDLRGHAPPLRH